MPAGSLLTLLDDIATVLDDVAVMTKVATKKTTGMLGDDLALNAQQVTGVRAERELPVVWAVAKGSAVNKAILVPAALAISALLPWLVTPLLMMGGLYLCFEGAEKVAHKLFHRHPTDVERTPEAQAADEGRTRAAHLQSLASPRGDTVAVEKKKIKGAIRTDLILSAEIITISLATVTDAPLLTRFLVLLAISVIMTVGVYGLVAGIVKLDDAGVLLYEQRQDVLQHLGRFILRSAPVLMKLLGIAGTIAMFLVGGGILTHGIPGMHGWLHHLFEGTGSAAPLVAVMADAAVGILAGAVVVAVVAVGKRVLKGPAQPHH